MLCGTDMNVGILRKILLVPHNTVMDMNNVMICVESMRFNINLSETSKPCPTCHAHTG